MFSEVHFGLFVVKLMLVIEISEGFISFPVNRCPSNILRLIRRLLARYISLFRTVADYLLEANGLGWQMAYSERLASVDSDSVAAPEVDAQHVRIGGYAVEFMRPSIVNDTEVDPFEG